MVAFSGKERKLGEQALSGITSNLKNTITGPKAIIGKKFHSDDIQQEMDWVAYKMVEKGGNVAKAVELCFSAWRSLLATGTIKDAFNVTHALAPPAGLKGWCVGRYEPRRCVAHGKCPPPWLDALGS